jgi:hypothetical protein
MKELLMLFAVIITLAVGIEMLPVMGSTRRLAVAENVVGGKQGEEAETIKRVSKHNLNRGQMKKMYWLPFVDKA